MAKFQLGRFTKKEIKIDSKGNIRIDSASFGEGDYTVEDILKIYVLKPSTTQGKLYLSTTGNNVTGDPRLHTTGFLYTKKQQDSVDKIVCSLVGLNPEIKVIGLDMTEKLIKSKNKNAVICPQCKSTNTVFMDNNRKSFSVGKAVGGAILTGGIGALAGFAGKKGNDRWHCQNCGNIFET